MKCLLVLRRIGPYHHARFDAACDHMDLHVLETRPQSQEYPWDFHEKSLYSCYQLKDNLSPECDPVPSSLDKQLAELIDQLLPDVVVSVGWADCAYQRLLIACHQRRLPLVIVSDSRQHHQSRSSVKEWIKHQLLRGYSAALVAGSESRAYLTHLGFPADAISQPWDVVDNDLFAAAASLPATGSASPHFLCVSRLVEVKNHRGLLSAFLAYQRQGGTWGLMLIGSGPLERELRQAMTQLPIQVASHFCPFNSL